MINIVSRSTKTYYFPIGKRSFSTQFTLKLYSELTLSTIEKVVSLNGTNSQYFPIRLTQVILDTIPNGEYNYSLYDSENEKVSIGLLRVSVGDSHAEYDVTTDYVVYDAFGDGFLTTQEGGGIQPTGTIDITENGTYDVTDYATAEINVPQSGAERIAELEAEVAALTTELEEAQAEITVDEARIAELEAQIAGLNAQIAALQAQIAAKDEQIAGLNESIQILRDANEDLLDTVRNQQETIQHKNEVISEMEDQIASVEPKVITENGTYTTSWEEDDVIGWNSVTVNVNDGSERIAELEAQVSVLQGEKAELEAQVATLTEEKATLENSVRALEELVAVLNDSVNTLTQQVQELTEQVASLTQEKADLEAQVASLNTQVQNLTVQVSSLTEQVNGLTAQISALEAEKTALEARLASITTLSVTDNGTYTPESGVEGWNSVTVNVPISGDTTLEISREDYEALAVKDPHTIYLIQGSTEEYQEGYNDGYAAGETDGYESGYAEGQASVPLTSKSITANGTYTNSTGGWNSVTVNVPSMTYVEMTQAQYDALATKDNNTFYIITD